MPYSTTAENQMLDALNGGSPTSIIAYASLHTAYSTSGANEVTGGSPAYARQAVTWSSSAGASKSSASVGGAFQVPGSTTILYVGLWSAVTSGTFAGMGPLGAGSPLAFTCTSGTPGVFTAPGSSFTNGATVVVFAGAGATLPTGITAGTLYYIVSASGATFELSTSSGGSPVNTSSTGAGIVISCTPETFGGQGTYTLVSDVLSLF